MSQPLRLRNNILSHLPDNEAAWVFASLEPVELPRNFVIASAHQQFEHVYFLEAGIGSVVAVSPEGNKIEAGMFGREGFAPSPVVSGMLMSPHDIVIQVPGFGHRIELPLMWQLLEHCPTLRDLMARFALSFSTQVTYTALSNAIHAVDERLARWLLMCHDRSDSNELEITHEYIARLLAVRRPSVTTSLHTLEGHGFIRSARKLIVIKDRSALEDFAHDAYGQPEREHCQFFGLPELVHG